MPNTRIPSATYRLQLNQSFSFDHATELVDYLKELGISDCYCSPIMETPPNSEHGYDVTNPCKINPELGTEAQFHQFSQKLQENGMGILLDIVPNHMCINNLYNTWWNDVLENGASSSYNRYFDIDWNPPKKELQHKVLLPILDQQYGQVIENRQLKVVYDHDAFYVTYSDKRLPLNPQSWLLILDPALHYLEEDELLPEFQSVMTALEHLPPITENSSEKIEERQREKEIIKQRFHKLMQKSHKVRNAIAHSLKKLNDGDFDSLEDLLKQQAYRLSFWRVANDEINYRRFFDVNDLAGIRTEDPDVFDNVHKLVFEFVDAGLVTGLRLDHVDGLYNPKQYFVDLQRAHQNLYITAEKILTGNEQLREDWSIHGTTGYGFLNLLNGIFVMESNQDAFHKIYMQFTRRYQDPTDLLRNCKEFVLTASMSSELQVLARQLDRISEQHRCSRDFTWESLHSALRHVIACFPVYRSYITDDIHSEDRHHIHEAIRLAKKHNPIMNSSIFDFIENVLLLNHPEGITAGQIAKRKNFVMQFQQLTGPVMAKGLEDTAFYRYFPLASLNEVGGDPRSFGVSIKTFHHKNQERAQKWPHALSTTSTHDTKRSEDVRARLNVLSEIPDEWNNAITQWEKLNRDHKKTEDGMDVPDRNTEYLLYQTLVGSWPMNGIDATYIERIEAYMIKAIKEAKEHTSWINPNQTYDEGVRSFVYSILRNPQFLEEVENFVSTIVRAGLYNSLAQTTLKIAAPGIPDFYQGTEIWDFSLVDPDNRRPVDFTKRRLLLKSDLFDLESGQLKMHIVKEGLACRRAYPELFAHGDYTPLYAEGERSQNIIAFARSYQEDTVIAAVARFYTQLPHHPVGNETWKNTHLHVPAGKYRDIYTGVEMTLQETVSCTTLFSKLPIIFLKKQ